MLDRHNYIEISILNGIKFKHLTIFRKELIILVNDGLTYKEIAELINQAGSFTTITRNMVTKWICNGSKPSDNVISLLETMHLKRYGYDLQELLHRLEQHDMQNSPAYLYGV